MPLQIDEVHTDVHVPAAGAEAAPSAPPPPWQRQEQWRRLQWQQQVDQARTSACGNDSGSDGD
jgi:hypothetical protein